MRKKYLFLLISLLNSFGFTSCQNHENQSSHPTFKINYSLLESNGKFLDTLQYRTFSYFLSEASYQNGLIKDRSTSYSPASIAAVGFAYPIWAIGAEHGWISRDKAVEFTLNSLKFFLNSPQSIAPDASGYRGFYYHFLNMKDGKREWESELSTIDTAWLIAGMRFSTQYFNRNDSKEIQIRHIADSLTFRIDWDWATLPDSGDYAATVSMGWTAEKGFNPMGWNGYNEGLYLYVLAAGSGYEGATKAYQRWLHSYQWEEPYPGLAHVVFPPLFGHQFSHLFIDFRDIQDSYMQQKGIDYFENSRRAVLTQRQYAIENPLNWIGYDSTTWGISSCDGPGEKYNTEKFKFYGYAGRGTSGPKDVYFDDGTIAPYAVAASIPFASEIVIPTLKSMYRRFAAKGLWKQYGFVDAFNLTAGWFDTDYLGIDQGPIVIMIENYRSGLVWKYCMQDPVIRKGLDILGFRAGPTK